MLCLACPQPLAHHEHVHVMPSSLQAIVASTGLELKADPGVPLVYAGFGGEPRSVVGRGLPRRRPETVCFLPSSRPAVAIVPASKVQHATIMRAQSRRPYLLPTPLPRPAAGLCVTTVVSYLSHSQVWAAQAGSGVMVGGSTNRAKVFFEQELSEILGAVPELPAAPALVDAAGSSGSGAQ